MAQRPPQDAEEGKILMRSPYEAKEDFENSLYQSFVSFQAQLTPPYHISPQSLPSGDLTQLNQAWIYAFLTQPRMQQSLFTHLTAITTDGYACIVSVLLRLVNEHYPKLLDQCRTQLLLLVKQLIALSASEVENLCLSLLRCIIGGDVTQWNVWLSGQVLDMLRNNWTWLIGNPGLLTSALFTFLRLLPDHFMAKNTVLNELRQDEASFCVKILRNCFQECLVIGRDLVRLLQDVTFIPEFESIWKDLLSNPSAFNVSSFTDIAQLYVVRTPTRYLLSRLTMEIRFMLTYVRMGNQRRYQAWFAQRFLSAPGSETLVCDLIRFICCVHHPPNHILQSDIVPRWAVIGWLLKCCKSQHVEANAKLALFYDWFFFMTKTDNIMNIEPALLLMVHSVPKYIDITHSLLEFLFLCLEHYDPSRKDLIARGVVTSVDILVSKGVVRSLEPLACNSHVSPWLREKLVAYFPMYSQAESMEAHKNVKQECVQQDVPDSIPSPLGSTRGVSTVQSESHFRQEKPLSRTVTERDLGEDNSESGTPMMDSNNGMMDNKLHKKRRIDIVTLNDLAKALTRSQEEAAAVVDKLIVSFLSDSDSSVTTEGNDDEKTGCAMESAHAFAKKVSDMVKASGHDLFTPLSGYLSDSLENDEIMSVTSAILRRFTQSNHPKLLQLLLAWHTEGYAVGARLLCYICRIAECIDQSNVLSGTELKPDLGTLISPKCTKEPHKDNELLCLLEGNESGKASAFSWHKALQMNELSEVGISQNSKVTSKSHLPVVSDAFKSYKVYIKAVYRKKGTFAKPSSCDSSKLENGIQTQEPKERVDELEEVLLQDLETCLTWSIQRLLLVIFMVFSHIPDVSGGKKQVIKLLVSVLDPRNLSKLELKLSLKEISVLGTQPDRIADLIKSSVSWDCFEQQYFWRILVAELHNAVPFLVENLILSCATFLKPMIHSDALSGFLLFLRAQWPTSNLIIILLGLPEDLSLLVAAVFASWVSLDATRFLNCLNAIPVEGLQTKEGSAIRNFLPLSSFVCFLNNFEGNSSEMDEKKKTELSQIKNTFLELVRR
mgnify:CR=1 FL=1